MAGDAEPVRSIPRAVSRRYSEAFTPRNVVDSASRERTMNDGCNAHGVSRVPVNVIDGAVQGIHDPEQVGRAQLG